MSTEGLKDTPRSGNDSGGGQLGNAIKCKPGGPNDYIYVVVQEAVWGALARRIGGEKLATDPRFATILDRRGNQKEMWALLTEFASKHTKWDLMGMLNEIDVPCGPILGTEDLVNDEHVKLRDMIVELDHPERGRWINVGMPIKLSDSPAEVKRSPSEAEAMTLKEAGAFSKETPKVKEYHPLREAG